MKTIFIFAEQTTTDGKRFLLGYELGSLTAPDFDSICIQAHTFLYTIRV